MDLTYGIMSASIIIGSIFFSSDQLFRMKQLPVGSGTNFIDNGRFQIYENGSGYVFSSSSFAEKRIETIIAASDGFIRWHLTIRLYSMFQTIQFPTGISDLNSGLTDVNRNTFPLKQQEKNLKYWFKKKKNGEEEEEEVKRRKGQTCTIMEEKN